jgi:hypothetical protein
MNSEIEEYVKQKIIKITTDSPVTIREIRWEAGGGGGWSEK